MSKPSRKERKNTQACSKIKFKKTFKFQEHDIWQIKSAIKPCLHWQSLARYRLPAESYALDIFGDARKNRNHPILCHTAQGGQGK